MRRETMILRTKNDEVAVRDRAGLLEFLRGELGMGKDEGGIRNVDSGVEVIAGVPFCCSAKAGEEKNTGVPWTFSTFDLDRFDERIDPAGWDFKQFLKNPVIQWAHCFSIPAIGRAEGLHSDEGGLHGSIIFNDKGYDPFGWAIGERVRAGVIRAGSVGFRALEIELPSKEGSKDGTSLIFRKQELLEFSVCNVPANPWALVKPPAMAKAVVPEEPAAIDLAAARRQFWGGFIGMMD
jgi:HK97 family phage prohead protease